MDTPEKKTQLSPSLLSTFEDSPVFNYISSLSPIKSFNIGHSGQSFQLLSFASPQSSQTTPPTNGPKESKITSASHISEAPKNNCSQSVRQGIIADTQGAAQPANLQIEEVDKFDSGGEVTVGAPDESSKLVIELPKPLKNDCDSSENSAVNCDAAKPNCELNVDGTEITTLNIIQDTREADCSYENEMGVQRFQLEQNKEVCDWEKFIYEASDILNYHSPTKGKHHEELDDKSVDPGTQSFVSTVLQTPNENVENRQKMESSCPPISSENHDMEIPLTKPGVGEPNETSGAPAVKAQAVLSEEEVHHSSTKTDDKSSSQQQQTTRRRCLVYEVSGARYRQMLSDPAQGSPISKPPASPKSSHDKSLVSSKPGSNRFSSLLPNIGLHLNAFAATARDKIIVRRQTLTCRRQLISSPSTLSSSDSLTYNPKPLNSQIAPDIAENVSNEQKDEVQLPGNACQNSTIGEGIEFHQSSPKKKRRKSENAGETDSCKRCNCKRSKCLKLYCECFAAGLYCVEPCNCQDCFNKPIHEETVLETRRQIESRNPLAFAPKVIKCSSIPHDGNELKKTPASARHKRGCNCKKSGCLKKYCECFQGGVGCSLSCRCEGCKNTFGRKEGTDGIAIYEEPQMLLKSAADFNLHHEVSKTEEENQEQGLETPVPSKNARQPVRRPCHFEGVLVPQSLPLPSGPSLQPCETLKNDKSDKSKIEEDVKIKIAPEDEDTKDLKGDYSLSICVKSASPNSKRVSPPHCDFETSPSWKSCRKLILRSISSRPTMTQEEKGTELQSNNLE